MNDNTTSTTGELLRLAAFTDTPSGGNPAGVWIGQELPPVATMQTIAADVGYSETAFVKPDGPGAWTIRYYSRAGEVSFCGHATIAAAVALADRDDSTAVLLHTAVGDVPVTISRDADGHASATLTSVPTETRPCPASLLTAALARFAWTELDLDRALRPALSYAGAWHFILPLASRTTLTGLTYDYDGLLDDMTTAGLTTVAVVWRENTDTFHARNPFPVGGVVEDPATGAAAAAFGAYLRAGALVDLPADIVIHQGHDMGRPSRLEVRIPAHGGIQVTGRAVRLL